jgi:hypothetical protein
MLQTSDSCLDTWMVREALAEAMIPVIGRLYRENNVVTSIHGRSLINNSTTNILNQNTGSSPEHGLEALGAPVMALMFATMSA